MAEKTSVKTARLWLNVRRLFAPDSRAISGLMGGSAFPMTTATVRAVCEVVDDLTLLVSEIEELEERLDIAREK